MAHGGEWDAVTLQGILGYVPDGLKRMAGLWNAPLQGYHFGDGGDAGAGTILAYILSAVVGLILVVAAVFAISRLVFRNDR